MKHTKKLLILMTIAWILLLMVVFSHSWIARNWTPSISQGNITISSSSALLITLEDNTNHESVSLNEVLNTESFTLQQVSSHDGETFHHLNFLPTLDGASPKFELTDASSGRYIEYSFRLRRQSANNPEEHTEKLVFIHPDTHITSKTEGMSDAIRISITINQNDPIILANAVDQRNDHVYTEASNATAAGKDIYTNYSVGGSDFEHNPEAVSMQTACGLWYYHGGRLEYTDDNDTTNDYDFVPDESRALIKLATDQYCDVTIKIWLEGGDENCTDAIAGETFDFLLKFDSVDLTTDNTAATE